METKDSTKPPRKKPGPKPKAKPSITGEETTKSTPAHPVAPAPPALPADEESTTYPLEEEAADESEQEADELPVEPAAEQQPPAAVEMTKADYDASFRVLLERHRGPRPGLWKPASEYDRIQVAKCITNLISPADNRPNKADVESAFNIIFHGQKRPLKLCGACLPAAKQALNQIRQWLDSKQRAKPVPQPVNPLEQRATPPMMALPTFTRVWLISEDYMGASIATVTFDNGTVAKLKLKKTGEVVEIRDRRQIVTYRHQVPVKIAALRGLNEIDTDLPMNIEEVSATRTQAPPQSNSKGTQSPSTPAIAPNGLPAWIKAGAVVTDGDDNFTIQSVTAEGILLEGHSEPIPSEEFTMGFGPLNI